MDEIKDNYGHVCKMRLFIPPKEKKRKEKKEHAPNDSNFKIPPRNPPTPTLRNFPSILSPLPQLNTPLSSSSALFLARLLALSITSVLRPTPFDDDVDQQNLKSGISLSKTHHILKNFLLLTSKTTGD